MKRSYIDPQHHALLMLNHAYGEYLAARHLLLNQFYLEGATMASYAVEKYLKVQLIIKGKNVSLHLDRIDEIKQKLIEAHGGDPKEDFTKLFDEHFFDVLSIIYKMRYFDNILDDTLLNFHVNQFLGELDYFVYLSQHLITSLEVDGKEIKSYYRISCDNKDPKLMENNYLFMGISKKEFMEREDYIFMRKITPGPHPIVLDFSRSNIKLPYNGKMNKYIVDVVYKEKE